MTSRKLMLVADDALANRVVLRELFRDEFDVIEAGSGEEALALIRQYARALSIVLLGVVMPDADGLRVLDRLALDSACRCVPVVAVTGDNTLQLAALQKGAWDVVDLAAAPELVRARVLNAQKRSAQMRTQRTYAPLAAPADSEKPCTDAAKLCALRQSFEDAPLAFAVAEVLCDPQQNPTGFLLRYFNRAFSQLAGIDDGEQNDNALYDLFQAADINCLTACAEVARKGTVLSSVQHMPKQNKHLRLWCYAPMPGTCAFVLTDISDEFSAREELRRARLQTEHLVDSIPGGVAICRLTDRIELLCFNDGVPPITGRTRQEFVDWCGEDAAATVCAEDLPRVRRAIEASLCTKRPLHLHYRCCHKDGNVVWIQLSAVQIGEEGGAPVYHAVFMGTGEETHLYQDLLDEAANGIYVCDADTHELLYMNQRCFEIVGAKPGDYSGQKCYKLLMRRDTPCPFCKMPMMTADQFCVRQFSPLHTEGHYLLKGKMVNWNGLRAHIEYIIDETELVTARNKLAEAVQCMQSEDCRYQKKGRVCDGNK